MITDQVQVNPLVESPVVIQATHDIQVLDAPPPVPPVVEVAELTQIWDHVVDLARDNQLTQSHPRLLSLLEIIKTHGVLPVSGTLVPQDIIQCHQWLKGLPSDTIAPDQFTLIEAKLLAAYADSMASPPFDRVVVLEGINAFDQYASICQVVVNGDTLTLTHDSDHSVAIEPLSESSIVFHRQWVWLDSSVDYATAHDALVLTEQDTAAINEWLTDVFPTGAHDATDEAIVMTVLMALQSDAFHYRPDVVDEWQPMASFLATKTGDCEEYSHLLFHALTLVYAALPDRQCPPLQVVAGTVRGPNMGHSVVEITLDGQRRVLDPSGAMVADKAELLSVEQYQVKWSFQPYISYRQGETVRHVSLDALATFSTAGTDDIEMFSRVDLERDLAEYGFFDPLQFLLLDSDIGPELSDHLGTLPDDQQLAFSTRLAQAVDAIGDDFFISASELNKILQDFDLSNRIIQCFLDKGMISYDDAYKKEDEWFFSFDSWDSRNKSGYIGSDDIYQALLKLGIVDPYGTISQDKLDEKKSALYDLFYPGFDGELETFKAYAKLKCDALILYLKSKQSSSQIMDYPSLVRLIKEHERAKLNDVRGVDPSNAWREYGFFDPLQFLLLDSDIGPELSDHLGTLPDDQQLAFSIRLVQAVDAIGDGFFISASELNQILQDSDLSNRIIQCFFDKGMISYDDAYKKGNEWFFSFDSWDSRNKTGYIGSDDIYQALVDLEIVDSFDEISQDHMRQNKASLESFFYGNADIDTRPYLLVAKRQFNAVWQALTDKLFFYTSESPEDRQSALIQRYDGKDKGAWFHLEHALLEFESVSEQLMKGLTMSPSHFTDKESAEYSFVRIPTDNEMFLKVNHKKLQELMSLFFSLQNKISALMTLMFSISDTASSISAKLGEEHSTASSTGKQRQKIIQAFNAFSSGINESVSNLTDIFEKYVEKTNESRYKGGLSEIELFYKKFEYQLGDAFLGNQYEIQAQQLQLKLSDDYFSMLKRNQRSMQQAMIDVPNVGKGITPTQFSHLFLGDEYNGVSSTQAWSALVAIGVIDEYGQVLIDGDSLNALFDEKFESNSISGSSIDIGQLDQVSAFLTQEWDKFKANYAQLSSDQQLKLKQALSDHVMRHKQTERYGFQGMMKEDFDLSHHLHAYMNMMERSTDGNLVGGYDVTRGFNSLFLSNVASDFDDASGNVVVDFFELLSPDAKEAFQSHKSEINHVLETKPWLTKDSFNFPDANKLLESFKEINVLVDVEGVDGEYELANGVHVPNGPFQMADVALMSEARKSLIQMNTIRRVYMTLVSAYTHTFERIASKLSKDATSSSHYGDWQLSLMESHIGLAEKQWSSIQSNAMAMINRMNEINKHQLNLKKMSDPMLRGFDIAEAWSSIAGGMLMMIPHPFTQFLGVLLSMSASVLGLAESWRGYQMEQELPQLMNDERFSKFQLELWDEIEEYLSAVDAEDAFSATAGSVADSVTLNLNDVPRAVVDYTNAHQYIDPDDSAIQGLLNNRIFPDGLPDTRREMVAGIHAFLASSATYVPDMGDDHWALVGDVAQTLTGDCEDLSNLEHSLILSALQTNAYGDDVPQSHAAYVTHNGQRLGHVYMTMRIDGEVMVLDPSLEKGQMMTLAAYQKKYNVEDVLTYTHDNTNVLSPLAIDLDTSSGEFGDGIDLGTGHVDESVSSISAFHSSLEGFSTGFDPLSEVTSALLDTINLDELLGAFIPNADIFQNGDFLEGRYNIDPGHSAEDIIQTFVGDTLSLMCDAFMKSPFFDGVEDFAGIFDVSINFDEFPLDTIIHSLITPFLPGNMLDFDDLCSSPGFDLIFNISDALFNTDQIQYNLNAGLHDHLLTTIHAELGAGRAVVEQDSFVSSTIDQATSEQIVNELKAEGILDDNNAIMGNVDLFDDAIDLGLSHQGHKAHVLGVLRELRQAQFYNEESAASQILHPHINSKPFETNAGQLDELPISQHRHGVMLDTEKQLTQLISEFRSSLVVDGGYFNQIFEHDGDHTSDLFLNTDTKNQRIMLNQFEVGKIKDSLRIYQERLRFVFLYSKIVSDAVATIAAQVGDDDKVKVAGGLQKIFETVFSLINVDVSLQDYLFGHYETVINHNFEVKKMRYERMVDSSFKTVNILPMLALPKYGQMIQSGMDIFQNFAMYYDFASLGNNDYTNYYIRDDLFLNGLTMPGKSRYSSISTQYDGLQYPFDSLLSDELQRELSLEQKKQLNKVLASFKKEDPASYTITYQTLMDSGITEDQSLAIITQLSELGVLVSDSSNPPGYIMSGEFSFDYFNFKFSSHPDQALDLLDMRSYVMYRQEAMRILKEAAAISPVDDTRALSLFSDVVKQVPNYEAFNHARDAMVGFGMQLQVKLIMLMISTGFLSFLSKSVRGDGKGYSTQHASGLIDVIERDVSHNLDELDRIQTMHEQAVKLNNDKYESMRLIEKSTYELIFFGAFSVFRLFNKASNLAFLNVKTFANMLQGIFLSQVTHDKGFDNTLEKNAPNEARRVPNKGDNWESNYLEFSYNTDEMILDRSGSDFNKLIGLGHQSVDWFKQAHQNMMLKKLFVLWELMLKSGQSRAEAYQGIAEELGGVVSTLSYSGALRSQMNLKKNLMTKSMDNRFSLAGQVVDFFNSIQNERFETFRQFLKLFVFGGVSYYRSRMKAERKQDLDFQKNSGLQFRDGALNVIDNFGNDMFLIATAAARQSVMRYHMDEAKKDMTEQMNRHVSYGGSHSERLLYMSNISKANYQVRHDLITKISQYQKFFKDVASNQVDTWTKYAKDIGESTTKSDSKLIKEKGEAFGQHILEGKHQAAQTDLKQLMMFLGEQKRSASDRLSAFSKNFGGSLASIIVGKSKYHAGLVPMGSVFETLQKTHQQMVRQGSGDAMEFKRVMDQLQSDIQALQGIADDKSKSSDSNGRVNANQFDRLQSIVIGLRDLAAIEKRVDNYKASSSMLGRFKTGLFQANRMYRGDLDRIADNVESFALFGMSATVVGFNRQSQDSDKKDKQLVNDILRQMEVNDKTNPQKIFNRYNQIGQFFSKMSQKNKMYMQTPKEDDPSGLLDSFFKEALSTKHIVSKQSFILDGVIDESESQNILDLLINQNVIDSNGIIQIKLHSSDQLSGLDNPQIKAHVFNVLNRSFDDEHQKRTRNFAKRVLAARTGKAKQTLKILAAPDDSIDIDRLLNGSNGIIDMAMRMGNTIGAKRLLHATSYSSGLVQKIKTSKESHSLSDAMLNIEQSALLANAYVQTALVDRPHVHDDLSDGKLIQADALLPMIGWRRTYTRRLTAIMNDAIAKIPDDDSFKSAEQVVALDIFLHQLGKSPKYATLVREYQQKHAATLHRLRQKVKSHLQLENRDQLLTILKRYPGLALIYHPDVTVSSQQTIQSLDQDTLYDGGDPNEKNVHSYFRTKLMRFKLTQLLEMLKLRTTSGRLDLPDDLNKKIDELQTQVEDLNEDVLREKAIELSKDLAKMVTVDASSFESNGISLEDSTRLFNGLKTKGVLTADGRLSPGIDLASIDLGLDSQDEMHRDHIIKVLKLKESKQELKYYIGKLSNVDVKTTIEFESIKRNVIINDINEFSSRMINRIHDIQLFIDKYDKHNGDVTQFGIVEKDAFVTAGIDQQASEIIWKELQQENVLDQDGVFNFNSTRLDLVVSNFSSDISVHKDYIIDTLTTHQRLSDIVKKYQSETDAINQFRGIWGELKDPQDCSDLDDQLSNCSREQKHDAIVRDITKFCDQIMNVNKNVQLFIDKNNKHNGDFTQFGIVEKDAFVTAGIDQQTSETIWKELRTNGVLDQDGMLDLKQLSAPSKLSSGISGHIDHIIDTLTTHQRMSDIVKKYQSETDAINQFRGIWGELKGPDDCMDMDSKLEQIKSCCELTFAEGDSTFKDVVKKFPPQYVAWLKQLQNSPHDLMNQLINQMDESKWKGQAMIDSKMDGYTKEQWADHFNKFSLDDFKDFHWASWSPMPLMLEGLRISLTSNSVIDPTNDYKKLKAIPEDVLMQVFFPSGNQPLQTFYEWSVANQQSLIESHPTFCIQCLSQLSKEDREKLNLSSCIPVFAKMTPWVQDPAAIYSLLNGADQTTYLSALAHDYPQGLDALMLRLSIDDKNKVIEQISSFYEALDFNALEALVFSYAGFSYHSIRQWKRSERSDLIQQWYSGLQMSEARPLSFVDDQHFDTLSHIIEYLYGKPSIGITGGAHQAFDGVTIPELKEQYDQKIHEYRELFKSNSVNQLRTSPLWFFYPIKPSQKDQHDTLFKEIRQLESQLFYKERIEPLVSMPLSDVEIPKQLLDDLGFTAEEKSKLNLNWSSDTVLITNETFKKINQMTSIDQSKIQAVKKIIEGLRQERMDKLIQLSKYKDDDVRHQVAIFYYLNDFLKQSDNADFFMDETRWPTLYKYAPTQLVMSHDSAYKHLISERVKDLSVLAIDRPRSTDYAPITEISTQLSKLPNNSRNDVMNALLEQFSLFMDHNDLASVSRLIEVVDHMLDHDVDADGWAFIFVGSNLQTFIGKVLSQPSTAIDEPQKQALLRIMMACDFPGNGDSSFSTFAHQIEQLVGLDHMLDFVSLKTSETRQEHPFLELLKRRLNLAIAQTDGRIAENAFELGGIDSEQSSAIWNELKANGVLGEDGYIESKFEDITNEVDRALTGSNKAHSNHVIKTLQQATLPDDLQVIKQSRSMSVVEFLSDPNAIESLTTLHKSPGDFNAFCEKVIIHGSHEVFELINKMVLGLNDQRDQVAMMHDFLYQLQSHHKKKVFSLAEVIKPQFESWSFFNHFKMVNGEKELTNLQMLLVQQLGQAHFRSSSSSEEPLATRNKRGIGHKQFKSFIQQTIRQCPVKNAAYSDDARFKMLAELIKSSKDYTQSRSKKSQFVQSIIHNIVEASDNMDDSVLYLNQVVDHLNEHQQRMMHAEIAHYFKGSDDHFNAIKSRVRRISNATTSSHHIRSVDDYCQFVRAVSTSKINESLKLDLMANLFVVAPNHPEANAFWDTYIYDFEKSSVSLSTQYLCPRYFPDTAIPTLTDLGILNESGELSYDSYQNIRSMEPVITEDSFTKIVNDSAQSCDIYNQLKTNGILDAGGNVISDVHQLHPNVPLDLGDLNLYKDDVRLILAQSKLAHFLNGEDLNSAFKQAFNQVLQAGVVEESSFVSDNINELKSTEIWQQLKAHGMLDQHNKIKDTVNLSAPDINLGLSSENGAYKADVVAILNKIKEEGKSNEWRGSDHVLQFLKRCEILMSFEQRNKIAKGMAKLPRSIQWGMAKIELPKAEQFNLRRQLVNAQKLKKVKGKDDISFYIDAIREYGRYSRNYELVDKVPKFSVSNVSSSLSIGS